MTNNTETKNNYISRSQKFGLIIFLIRLDEFKDEID